MKLEVENNPPSIAIGSMPFTPGNNVPDVTSLLNHGIRSAQAGDRSEARTALFKVTEADPSNEAAWLWLASISEYPEELLVFLNNVLDINPENDRAKEWKTATNSLLAKTFVQRGIDAAAEGRADLAQDCFDRALEHDQENINAWLWMASLSNDHEGKLNYLDMALKIDPNNETALAAYSEAKRSVTAAHLAAAKTAAVNGNKADAWELLEAVIGEDPLCEDAWLLKAHFADTFSEKISAFERVIEINGENAAARYGLDSLRSLIGDAPRSVDSAAESPSPASIEEEPSEHPADKFVASAAATESAPELDLEPGIERIPTQELVLPETIIDEIEEASAAEGQSAAEMHQETSEAVAFQPSPDEFQDPIESDAAEYEIAAPIDLYDPEQPPAEPFSDEYSTPEHPEQPEWPITAGPAATWPEPASDDFSDVDQNEDSDALVEMETGASFEAPTDTAYEEVQEEASTFSMQEPAAEDSGRDQKEPHISMTYKTISIPPAVIEAPVYDESIHETSANADIHETVADEPMEEVPQASLVSEQILIPAASDFESGAPETGEAAAAELSATAHSNGDEMDPFATLANFSIPMPDQQIPEPVEAANPFATNIDPIYVRKQTVPTAPFACAFCKTVNDASAISCISCLAVLTLADLDTVISNPNADRAVIRRAVDRMEAEMSVHPFGESELTMLGIGQLNLGNLQHGYNFLYEAARLNPDNIVLSSQVNALLIRLEDVRKHEIASEAMVKGKTILVVDDSATVRKLIAGKLEKCGHTVFCSPDGVDALEALRDVTPDLILLDINMPRMDGYQTCKTIRSNAATQNIPIVMISGKDGFFDKVRGRMAGSSGYITKPFGPETLMKTVESYLSGEAQPVEELASEIPS